MLGDFAHAAREAGTVINAVMLGAIAGSGILPMPVEAFERAIRGEGKGVDASMRGFNYGLAVARGEVVELQPRGRACAPAATAAPRNAVSLNALRDRIVRDYPAALREIVLEGAARTADYQDIAYANLYLDRLDKILAADRAAKGDFSATRETARYLALWMTYEDVIRVAQIKTRAGARSIACVAGAGGKPEQTVDRHGVSQARPRRILLDHAGLHRAAAARLGRPHRPPRQLQCRPAHPHQHDLRLCSVARDGRDEVLAPARPSLRRRAAD